MLDNIEHKQDLSAAELALLNYFQGATTCHAYDMNGSLSGKVILEIEFNGFSNSCDIIDSTLVQADMSYDPSDE